MVWIRWPIHLTSLTLLSSRAMLGGFLGSHWRNTFEMCSWPNTNNVLTQEADGITWFGAQPGDQSTGGYRVARTSQRRYSRNHRSLGIYFHQQHGATSFGSEIDQLHAPMYHNHC